MLINITTKLVRRVHRKDRGQIFVMVALMLAIFCGMAAFAVDYGSYATERRDLQNAADAIALAASQELPDSAAAQSIANQWATKNGIDPSLMTVTIIPQSLPSQPNPEVQVQIDDVHEFYFAAAVGVNEADISARAVAIKTSAAGGSGIVPLSVTDESLNGVGLGEPVVLKVDSTNISQGNTGPIRIDGPGAGNCANGNGYCHGVQYGSDNIVCADGADPTYCTGPTVVDTEPGNVIGPTESAIDYRMDNTSTACDEFEEVFEDDPMSSDPGVYHIVQACNPYLASSSSSLRVIIVPVIDELCNGSCPVTIVGFALFFLEGFANGGCQGNDCEIIGRFVRVNQNMGLLAGTFDPESFNSFVRLVE